LEQQWHSFLDNHYAEQLQSRGKKSNVLYCCGNKGHYASKCPEKDKQPKEEKAVKKSMMHAQAISEKESKEKDDDDNASQGLQRSNKSETKGKR
jgi:hypothetical protein